MDETQNIATDSTPDENEEKLQSLIKYLKLNLSKEQLNSARNYFNYGIDSSKTLNDIVSGQQKFDFDE